MTYSARSVRNLRSFAPRNPTLLSRQVNDFGHEPLRKLLYASVRQLIAEIYAPAYVARHEGLCHYELAAAHHQSGSVVEHLFRGAHCSSSTRTPLV